MVFLPHKDPPQSTENRHTDIVKSRCRVQSNSLFGENSSLQLWKVNLLFIMRECSVIISFLDVTEYSSLLLQEAWGNWCQWRENHVFTREILATAAAHFCSKGEQDPRQNSSNSVFCFVGGGKMHTHGKLRVKAELQPPSRPGCFYQWGGCQMADLPVIIQQQMCLSEILSEAHGRTQKQHIWWWVSWVIPAGVQDRKSHRHPFCYTPTIVNAMPAGEMWAGITASVFSTNHCCCLGTDSRLLVFHNLWYHIAFKPLNRFWE